MFETEKFRTNINGGQCSERNCEDWLKVGAKQPQIRQTYKCGELCEIFEVRITLIHILKVIRAIKVRFS